MNMAFQARHLLSPLDSLGIFSRMDPLCFSNCSGHGDCLNGSCICEVEFDGPGCQEFNRRYFVAFASFFYFISAVSIGQLLVCTYAEFHRSKVPTVKVLFRVTTQKLMHILVFIAAALRAVYFSSQDSLSVSAGAGSPIWIPSLMSAYYPVLLSIASLLVCFWAEVFHIPGVRTERTGFLSKSYVGFLTFNALTYSVFVTETILLALSSEEGQTSLLIRVFNGLYAALLFVVVVFFLIYGVEVYFKVRGGFLQPSPTAPFPLQVLSLEERTKENTTTTPGPCGETQQNQTPEEQLPMSFGPQRPPIHPLSLSQVNPGQLHQSRFGLVFQAFVLLSTVGFLLSDILGTFWKDKVPVVSRNWHSIVFRLVEVAATLWFPCCLWNSLRPDQLWILNPKRVLRRPLEPHWGADEDRDAGEESDGSDEPECWICFDRGSQNSPLIQPCRCRGGVGAVHHECLRRWLMESAGQVDNQAQSDLSCRVCGEQYRLEIPNGLLGLSSLSLKKRHWFHTTLMVLAMCGASTGTWAVFQTQTSTAWRLFVTLSALLVHYVCFRFLGFSAVKAYNRARFSLVRILEPESISSQGRNGSAKGNDEPLLRGGLVATIVSTAPPGGDRTTTTTASVHAVNTPQ